MNKKPQANPFDPFGSMPTFPTYGISTSVVIPKYDGNNYEDCFMARVQVAQQQPNPEVGRRMMDQLSNLLNTGSAAL